MEKLPPVFDLLFDVKTIEDLHYMLIHDLFDVVGIIESHMDKHKIAFPEKYHRRSKKGFPLTVWIDNHGGYITQTPAIEQEHKYQMMHVS